jgi:serine/threonine protein phosphatase PrpC
MEQWIARFFESNGTTVPESQQDLFARFLQREENKALTGVLVENGNRLMQNWKLEERVAEILQQPLRIPNGTVGKPYAAKIGLEDLSAKGIVEHGFSGLEELGLRYDAAEGQITGVPTQSGDLPIRFRFRIEGQAEDAFHEKPLTLIINPDPKSLWKNLESDKADPHWKEDNVTVFAPLGDRHILVSSKRGRSHANVGSFREDDFAFSSLEQGWQIVVVADGAGSARLSRRGSELACRETVDFFQQPEAVERLVEFEGILHRYRAEEGGAAEKELNRFIYQFLGRAAFTVHKKLEAFALAEGFGLKDLSTTLIFTLWKKTETGYAFLSFGVGDCPIAVLNREETEVTLMNWIDVGEFGGGTRFITMPEIFKSEAFATRFSFKVMDDFSYLFLMSDGIYDPKFVVEAALPKIEKWRELLDDLGGKNGEGAKVDLRVDNEAIGEEFSRWMDFWSPGNHDDRTLAIIF